MGKELIAMLLAGGQGARLYALTQKLAKPAVPFGGKYRIIDFPLSNCVNSGIDTVGILTQYQPMVLNEYIGNGQPWDLDRLYGGVHILPPYQQASGSDWYKGTANAIYQNISFFGLMAADGCVIEGEVENCVLFRGVKIGKGAKVKNCVLMQDTVVEANTDIEYIITDKNVTISEGKRLKGNDTFQVYVAKRQIV